MCEDKTVVGWRPCEEHSSSEFLKAFTFKFLDSIPLSELELHCVGKPGQAATLTRGDLLERQWATSNI
jgi:hypothetical protein